VRQPNTIGPVHQHDCDRCEYIGTYEGREGGQWDVYHACDFPKFNESRFIARWSSDGPDYATTNNLDFYLKPE